MTIQVPVTKVVVNSSTFTRWIEIIGERDTILGINGLYTTSPCLNQRFVSKQTLDYSAVWYNPAQQSYSLVVPKFLQPARTTLN